MALTDDFAGAQARVKALSKTPAPDELLELYALYKQVTAGDATGARPWMKSPEQEPAGRRARS